MNEPSHSHPAETWPCKSCFNCARIARRADLSFDNRHSQKVVVISTTHLMTIAEPREGMELRPMNLIAHEYESQCMCFPAASVLQIDQSACRFYCISPTSKSSQRLCLLPHPSPPGPFWSRGCGRVLGNILILLQTLVARTRLPYHFPEYISYRGPDPQDKPLFSPLASSLH